MNCTDFVPFQISGFALEYKAMSLGASLDVYRKIVP